jgi:demethylmenaquinone methyltransferase / 2-methoxy-6-polyprenyl-1,4-benzoquinol methylase
LTTSPAADLTAGGVRAMFDRVAPRYDLANLLLSLGQARHWWPAAAAATRLAPGEVALDVACGTGSLTHELARYQPRARVLGADFSWEMVRRAPAGDAAWPRGGAGEVTARPTYVVGDAMRLPLADASVDVVTIAFGLRNLPDPDGGLREFRRVLRPGGRLVVCEFSRPVLPGFRVVYERYLTRLLPLAARLVTSDPAAYAYLAHSVGSWPDQAGLANRVRAAGFEAVRWRNLSGGIVALHRGIIPTVSQAP